MLEVRSVVAGYGRGLDVLKEISLAVAPGEAVCLLGPNGAGKTTLMAALSGLLPLRRGEVLFEGQAIHRLAAEERVRRGLVLVPEGRRVFPRLSTQENLLAGAHLVKDKAVVKQRLDKVLGIFPRLAERLHQPAATFSGGEQQMLALGRALMSGPRLLLLDEPSMGLAPTIVQQVYGVLGDLVREGLTVLLVEQNAHMALRLTQRAYLLNQGRVIKEAEAASLRGTDEVEKSYLGD